MHPPIVADPDSRGEILGTGRLAHTLGLLAPIVGMLVAGPLGAGAGLMIMLLILQIWHRSTRARH